MKTGWPVFWLSHSTASRMVTLIGDSSQNVKLSVAVVAAADHVIRARIDTMPTWRFLTAIANGKRCFPEFSPDSWLEFGRLTPVQLSSITSFLKCCFAIGSLPVSICPMFKEVADSSCVAHLGCVMERAEVRTRSSYAHRSVLIETQCSGCRNSCSNGAAGV